MSESEPIKVSKKIVNYAVSRPDDTKESETPENMNRRAEDNIVHMHEHLERPEMLLGSTYKVKTPLDDHAMYVTINDHILNEGTEHEKRVPYEVFINSKNMEHFQWVVALTRVISAVFRKGGDVTFLSEELKSVFDPKGGFFDQGVYVTSTVAKLGMVIEKHLKMIGLIETEELSDEQKKLIAEKRAQYASTHCAETPEEQDGDSNWPAEAVLCNKCNEKAVILLDNCMTCLACADSKCG